MSNRLAREKSPYLLQHANNPVDWFPWGEEAFSEAKNGNKLIFLSIGYSTCYWCHVMEKECFEKDDVGAALRENFVSIKVDREEHPDVDEIYMHALMAMNGQGGWPMSVFLTPDLKPFWGGTYIPREHFLQLIKSIEDAWKTSPGQILNGGEKLFEAIREPRLSVPTETISQSELFQRFCSQADQHFDPEFGGFSGAPKFPSSQTIRLLLRMFREKRHPRLLEMAVRSLDRMSMGGIYDQLGGGFHRYAVDEKWLVPHFEKMLYDNALLVPAYLEAYWLTGRERYAQVGRETLDYLLRDLRHSGGAFFAAEDAGDVRREGEFYVWKEQEVRECLGADFSLFSSLFPLTEAGNFEHSSNVLHLEDTEKWEESRSLRMKALREKLLQRRADRKRPHLDTKILSGWNGLAISAFSMGYQVLGEEKYLSAAMAAAGWIREHLFRNGRLLRRFCDGDARYQGTSADYAYLIQGLIALYEASFEPDWLIWATELQNGLDRDFSREGGGYYTAAISEKGLITRKMDRSDGALPSPNSVAYGNLLKLSQYLVNPEFDDKASELFLAHGDSPEKYPLGLTSLLLGLYLRQNNGPRLLVLSGMSAGESQDFLKKLRMRFLPDLLLGMAQGNVASGIPVLDGKAAKVPTAYLCEDGTCHPPKAAGEILELLR